MRLKDVLNVKIGGKKFDIVKNNFFSLKDVNNACGTTLDNCYDRYSKAKESIYNEWLQWSVDNDCFDFGINSYNTNIFTLTMCYSKILCDNYLYITPLHNTLVLNPDTYNELKSIVYQLKKEFNNVLRQYDTSRTFNSDYDPFVTFKYCINSEVPSFKKLYDPLFEKILGIKSEISFNVMNALYNEYVGG